jgi:hypothetical protein
LLFAEWLRQEIHRAVLHRTNRRRNITVPGDEYDGRVGSSRELALQVEAIDVRQFDVEYQAGGQFRPRNTHELGGRCEGAGVVSARG